MRTHHRVQASHVVRILVPISMALSAVVASNASATPTVQTVFTSPSPLPTQVLACSQSTWVANPPAQMTPSGGGSFGGGNGVYTAPAGNAQVTITTGSPNPVLIRPAQQTFSVLTGWPSANLAAMTTKASLGTFIYHDEFSTAAGRTFGLYNDPVGTSARLFVGTRAGSGTAWTAGQQIPIPPPFTPDTWSIVAVTADTVLVSFTTTSANVGTSVGGVVRATSTGPLTWVMQGTLSGSAFTWTNPQPIFSMGTVARSALYPVMRIVGVPLKSGANRVIVSAYQYPNGFGPQTTRGERIFAFDQSKLVGAPVSNGDVVSWVTEISTSGPPMTDSSGRLSTSPFVPSSSAKAACTSYLESNAQNLWVACGSATTQWPASTKVATGTLYAPIIALAPDGQHAVVAWIDGAASNFGTPKYGIVDVTNPAMVTPITLPAQPNVSFATDPASTPDLRFDGQRRLWMTYVTKHNKFVVSNACDPGTNWGALAFGTPLVIDANDAPTHPFLEDSPVLQVDGPLPILATYKNVSGNRFLQLRDLAP